MTTDRVGFLESSLSSGMSVSYCCCRPSLELVERDGDEPCAALPGASGQEGYAASAAAGGQLGGDLQGPLGQEQGLSGPEERPFQPDEPPEPIDGEPARRFPFKLDPFQDYAIRCLHKDESVMVSAHTSAGKTVVAQYAIAMAMQRNQRVIYTTPIKALSNQKFRDLKEAFEEFGPTCIGLMTGDVTANPEASCIVMTTEILRSMLYHGSAELREVSWVVFDEVHYLRDKERGVVWEESIVLLPPSIKLAFLSATIPNAKEFAQWISDLKRMPCHVITTDFRPTPLQHYMFPAGAQGIFLCVDEHGVFRKENFELMMRSMDGDLGGDQGERVGEKRKKGSSSDIQKVVKCVIEQKLAPAIVFSFSRRECEALALQLSRSKLELASEEEQGSIREVYESALACLSDSDQQLPQIKLFLPLLLSGVGVHHSGILPILRELVELLFQEGLIKVLFATETFALGLNMPAKTCVFSNCRKFDGSDQRWISSGEYIQMAGRAGRRGLDDRGVVITMFDQRLNPEVAQGIICGEASQLTSTFHLGYNIILNATRTTGVDIDTIITRSFHHYQNTRMVPSLVKRLLSAKSELSLLPAAPEHSSLADFIALDDLRANLEGDIAAASRDPAVCIPFLCPGRVVRVCMGDAAGDDWGWGAVVSFQCRTRPLQGQSTLAPRTSPERFVVDVVLAVSDNSGEDEGAAGAKKAGLRPCSWRALKGVQGETSASGGKAAIVAVSLAHIAQLSAVRIYLANDLRPEQAVADALQAVYQATSSFPGGIPPLLSVVDDMGGSRVGLAEACARLEDIKRRMDASEWAEAHREVLAHEARGLADGEGELREGAQALYACRRRAALEKEIVMLRAKYKGSKLHAFKEELKGRTRVLRRMNYINDDGIVTVKGRCACEVEISQDLVAVEMMLSGAFNSAAPEDIAAVLSCLIVEEKDTGSGHVQEVLLKDMLKQVEVARRAKCDAEAEAGLGMTEPDAVNTCLMDLMHSWCKGCEFADLCATSNLFEGSIIRAMRREAELIRQMVNGAAAIGDSSLEKKFADTLEKLQRGLPFSASLYL